MNETKNPLAGGTETQDRWAHASPAFKAEHPWCGWTLAFAADSDWDTTGFGLRGLENINILLTSADGRSRPCRLVNWQYVDDAGADAGIEVTLIDSEHYEPIDRNQLERVAYDAIREIVVF